MADVSSWHVVRECRAEFEQRFGRPATICSVAPGRVNLIGEHVDYCDGLVMPMAIPLYTVMVGAVNDSPATGTGVGQCVLKSLSQADAAVLHFDDLTPKDPKWANYIRGVIDNYPGGAFPSFDAVIGSTIPLGGGLSSSAALEVAAFTFLEAIAEKGNNFTLKDKAMVCLKAEQDYAGLPCGIMDQFIVTMGKKNHALLIDCRSMESEDIPLSPDLTVLVTDSNVRHDLAVESDYANRRNSCVEAANLLGKSLRDVTMAELEASQSALSEVTYRRARHVIGEIQRTKQAADVLKSGNFTKFGTLMNESHRSLATDFDVSCVELDQLVTLSQSCEGVFGSRMTGGGFGGCTVTLCTADAVSAVKKKVQENYKGTATFYETTAVGGAYWTKC